MPQDTKLLLDSNLRQLEQQRLWDALASDDTVLCYAEADLSMGDYFALTSLVLYEDRLTVLRWSRDELQHDPATEPWYKNFSFFRKAPAELAPRAVVDRKDFSVAQIEKMQVENEVVGGLLSIWLRYDAAEEAEPLRIAHFSSSQHRAMARLVQRFEVLKKALEESAEEGLSPEERRSKITDELAAADRARPQLEPERCPNCGRLYPEAGRAFCPHCLDKGSVFRRLTSYFLERPWVVALFFTMLILEGILNAVLPWLTGSGLFDVVLGGNVPDSLGRLGPRLTAMAPMERLKWLLYALVLSRVLQAFTQMVEERISSRMVPGMVAHLRSQAFSNLQNLSLGFFSRRHTGSLMQRINQDAADLTVFFIEYLPFFVFAVITMTTSIVFMFRMHVGLAILAIAFLPLTAILSFVIFPRLTAMESQRSSASRSVYSVLNDTMQGSRVLRAFGQEEEASGRFRDRSYRLRDAERNVLYYQLRFQIPYHLARFVPMALIWAVGAFLIFRGDGTLSYGELITFVVYLNLLQGPLSFLSEAFVTWGQSMNAAQRIYEIIDAEPEIQEIAEPKEIEIRGGIEFRDVSFAYELNRPILKNINIEIKPGEMLGIVGRSGAGKSTFVNLISRLYDVDEGAVLIDGVDVRELSFKSLRGQIGMVSQESYIFMGSVSDNIAYGKPDVGINEIVEAAITAHAHPFIARLADGYDTQLGTGFRDLSGGERQRVSIARAILLDPPILVLDEATSAVDTETERAIQRAFDELVKDRTTISIAHRLSTLRDADRIIVMDDGRITEQGSPQELLEQQGDYYRLHQLQAEALDWNRESLIEGLDAQEEEKMAEEKKAEQQAPRNPEQTEAADGQATPPREAHQPSAIEQSLEAIEEKIRIRKLTPENARFRRVEGGFVSLEVEGEFTPRIQVHRCFPFTAPESWLSIRKNDNYDGELGLIENLSDFDPATQDLLREQMELRYFMPTITHILKVKEEYGYAYWDVETDRGPISFVMRTRSSSVLRLKGGRYLISDIDGDRYEIPDVDALSPQERRRIEMYI